MNHKKEITKSKTLDCLDTLLSLDIPSELNLNDMVVRDPKDKMRFICIICKESNAKASSGLLKNIAGHFTSKTHSQNMEKKQLKDVDLLIRNHFSSNTPSSPNQNQIEENPPSTANSLDDKALKVELAAFMLKERIPYKKAPAIVGFIKGVINKYELQTISKTQANRETICAIAKDCIGASIKESLFNELKQSPFSLSLDEASDFYKNSYLALCAKFLTPKEPNKLTTKLISIIEMKGERTGEALKEIIKEEVLCKDPKLERNFMGIATDQAGSMVGKNLGLGALLQSEYPYIVCKPDLSHIFNLICKSVVKVMPKTILQTVGELTAYFRYSCQRRYRLRRVQEEFKKSNLVDVLKYTEVRWLSLSQSINRLLELWDPMKVYFRQEKDLEYMKKMTTENRLQLRIVADLLSYLAHYNLIFQQSDLLYDEIIYTLEESLRVFGNLVFKKQFTHDEILDLIPNKSAKEHLDPHSYEIQDFIDQWLDSHNETKTIYEKYQENLRRKTDIQVDKEAHSTENPEVQEAELEKEEEENEEKESEPPFDVTEMFESLKCWIFKILTEMKKRLPYNDGLSQLMRVVFLEEFKKESWEKLRIKFTNIISEEKIAPFQLELSIMRANFAKHKTDHTNSRKSILFTWSTLEEKYPNMAQLAKALLVLPSSTVPVERVFSQLKDYKNPKRSRLTTENLEASLLVYQEYQSFEFQLTEDMMERYRNLWTKKKKAENPKIIKEVPLIEDQEPETFIKKLQEAFNRQSFEMILTQDNQESPFQNFQEEDMKYEFKPDSLKRTSGDSKIFQEILNFFHKKNLKIE